MHLYLVFRFLKLLLLLVVAFPLLKLSVQLEEARSTIKLRRSRPGTEGVRDGLQLTTSTPSGYVAALNQFEDDNIWEELRKLGHFSEEKLHGVLDQLSSNLRSHLPSIAKQLHMYLVGPNANDMRAMFARPQQETNDTVEEVNGIEITNGASAKIEFGTDEGVIYDHLDSGNIGEYDPTDPAGILLKPILLSISEHVRQLKGLLNSELLAVADQSLASKADSTLRFLENFFSDINSIT